MNGIRGNVIVGQSGGPTAVINSSLAGVFKTAKDRGANKVYGMLHGIQGLLQERYVDLEDHIKNDLDIELLKRTPSAYLRSCFMGVPKTIDNDLAATDHTPGYGSAAKYIGSITKEVIRDGLVYDQQNVTILEIMGRNAGWLTGAAALAKCEDCEGPDRGYF